MKQLVTGDGDGVSILLGKLMEYKVFDRFTLWMWKDLKTRVPIKK